jgi:hypothetical protein
MKPALRPATMRAMSLLVWVLVGMALWHFTVLLPDRFYGGIIGALIAAVAGALLTATRSRPQACPPTTRPGSRRRSGPSPARSPRWVPRTGGAPVPNATTPNRIRGRRSASLTPSAAARQRRSRVELCLRCGLLSGSSPGAR